MHSTNLFTIADAEYRKTLRAKFLGDAIPARSFATGANPLHRRTGVGNVSLQSCLSNASKWPKKVEDSNVWEHSDFKNAAFFFNYLLFKKIVNEESE
jgi:hypothetical protein